MDFISMSEVRLYEGHGIPVTDGGVPVSSQYRDLDTGNNYILTLSGWFLLEPSIDPSRAGWRLVSDTYQSVDGDLLLADTTTGAFAITLPITPTVGEVVQFSDAQGTWASNNLTAARNGQLIMGLSSDLVSNVAGANFGLVFAGGATGWRILQ